MGKKVVIRGSADAQGGGHFLLTGRLPGDQTGPGSKAWTCKGENALEIRSEISWRQRIRESMLGFKLLRLCVAHAASRAASGVAVPTS